jgi:hypothetical protein
VPAVTGCAAVPRSGRGAWPTDRGVLRQLVQDRRGPLHEVTVTVGGEVDPVRAVEVGIIAGFPGVSAATPSDMASPRTSPTRSTPRYPPGTAGAEVPCTRSTRWTAGSCGHGPAGTSLSRPPRDGSPRRRGSPPRPAGTRSSWCYSVPHWPDDLGIGAIGHELVGGWSGSSWVELVVVHGSPPPGPPCGPCRRTQRTLRWRANDIRVAAVVMDVSPGRAAAAGDEGFG